MTFVPSKFQQAIFDFIKNDKRNLVVNAVAGSGKTTTLLEALNCLPRKTPGVALFLAFNKSIVNELSSRVPSYANAKTFHQLGLSVLYKLYGSGTFEIDPFKAPKAINQVLDDQVLDERELNSLKNRVRQLVDLGRLNLANNEKQLYEIAEKHGISCLNKETEKALDLINVIYNDVTTFDFVDMVYHPAVNRKSIFRTYLYVFVDEAQDLSPAQHKLLEKSTSVRGGRFIAIGDERQAIYSFAGADDQSFKRLYNKKQTSLLPLSVCYRCARSILNTVQPIVPQIEPHSSAPNGEVRDGSISELREGDWVLCRTYRPLAKLCIDLIKQGKKAQIRGADFAKTIISDISQTLRKDLSKIVEQLKQDYQALEQRYIDYGLVGDDLKHHPVLNDKRERNGIINVFAQRTTTKEQLVKEIKNVFVDNITEGVVLSTIHKSKGLENDRVFIIRNDLIPYPHAKKPWQKKQEQNLKYVAYTRAKQSLIFINDWKK